MKLVIDISEEYYKTIKETKKEVVPIGWVSIQDGIKYEERPHGHWVYGTCLDGSEYCHCSECGGSAGYDYYGNHEESDYCPNCGAEMDEEGESE